MNQSSQQHRLEVSRRHLLRRAACGFGSIALSALLANESVGEVSQLERAKTPHLPPTAKRIVFFYMDGGPSQVDTFDPKPLLNKENGKAFGKRIEPTQFNNIGKVLASPWKFRRFGESGIPVSELFPFIARNVDDMAIIRSMTSEFSEHSRANYFLHTGTGLQGRPSMGAWLGYGLGSAANDLPAFVVLNGGLIPPGGLDCFNSGFLPATHQGSIFKSGQTPVSNIIPPDDSSPALQRKKLALVKRLDLGRLETTGQNDEIESAIRNYELAYRMQSAVPELTDLNRESKSIHRLYGTDSSNKAKATYSRQCLLARRLLERGVRFIEVTCPNIGHDRWDQHSNLAKGHADNAFVVDQGIGAFLTDLKQRGLLEDTLVVWSGEFGRTPFAQGSNGRDHNPFGFSLWMAGGGIRGGTIFGKTDSYGYKVVQDKLMIHDLHATMLHAVGLDHTRLTYRWSGRDMRLTDVHGKVVDAVFKRKNSVPGGKIGSRQPASTATLS